MATYAIYLVKLHRIPGTYIFGVFGSFGVGKTLYLVEKGIELANYHRKSIAANFYLNEKYLKYYAKKFNFSWVASVSRIRHSLTFEELLLSENSIILLDEAGVEIFSRTWQARKAAELDSLFRIRHYRNKMLYAAQDWSQVDVQFRRMTHLCIWIKGFQIYPEFGDPQLISRLSLYFDTHIFENFISDPINKTKIVFPLVKSGFRFDFNRIKFNLKYKYLFASYNSFDSHRTRPKAKSKQVYFNHDYHPNLSNKPRVNREINLEDLL